MSDPVAALRRRLKHKGKLIRVLWANYDTRLAVGIRVGRRRYGWQVRRHWQRHRMEVRMEALFRQVCRHIATRGLRGPVRRINGVSTPHQRRRYERIGGKVTFS